jgi:hypothetical protein
MEQLADLKEELKNWEAEDSDDVNNLLHRYFESTQLLEWCDIADEARVAYELMFDEVCEEYSPLDALITGAAAQSANGVWQAVANALGLNRHVLESTLEPWYMPELHGPRKVLTLDEFKAAYEKEHACYKEHGLLGKL